MMANSHRGLLLTIGIGGHDRLFSSCVESHRVYAERNGFYHLIVNQAPAKLESYEAAWLKLWLISMALDRGYEWVAYIDADCEIRAHTPLCRDGPLFRDHSKSIFMAPGTSGRFNSGVILVRNTPEARAFFHTVIANANQPVPRADRAPYENGHVIHYANRNACVGRLPHREWNNNSELNADSFVQHYSTGPLRTHYFARIGHKATRPSWRMRLVRKWRRLTTNPSARIRERISDLSGYYRTQYPGHFGAVSTSSPTVGGVS